MLGDLRITVANFITLWFVWWFSRISRGALFGPSETSKNKDSRGKTFIICVSQFPCCFHATKTIWVSPGSFRIHQIMQNTLPTWTLNIAEFQAFLGSWDQPQVHTHINDIAIFLQHPKNQQMGSTGFWRTWIEITWNVSRQVSKCVYFGPKTLVLSASGGHVCIRWSGFAR